MKHQQLKRVPLVYWTLVDPIGEVAHHALKSWASEGEPRPIYGVEGVSSRARNIRAYLHIWSSLPLICKAMRSGVQ